MDFLRTGQGSLFRNCLHESKHFSSNRPRTLILDDIESEMVNFTLKGDVIVQGDLNARTGSMQEFAVHDDDNQFLEIPEDYEIDTENYRTKIQLRDW